MSRIKFGNNWIVFCVQGFVLVIGLIVFFGLLPGLRPWLVFGFFMICPGVGFIRILDLKEPLIEVVLIIALSLLIDTVVAMLLLYFSVWSYKTGFVLLAGVSLLGSISLYYYKNAKEHNAE